MNPRRIVALLFVLTPLGCTTAVGEHRTNEPQSDDIDVDLSDDVTMGELGDEDAVADEVAISEDTEVGAVGERSDCGLYVTAKSPDAVADPCVTTSDFMDSLGFTAARQARVMRQASFDSKTQQTP